MGGGKRKLQQEMGARALIAGMKCNFGLQLEVAIVTMAIEEERGGRDDWEFGPDEILNHAVDKLDFYHLKAPF